MATRDRAQRAEPGLRNLDQRATLRSMSEDDLHEHGLTRDDLRDEMFRVP